MNPRFMERVRAITQQIRRELGEAAEQVPSVLLPPTDQDVDDGVVYMDPLADNRPDFVKQALKGWRPMGGPRD